jgi:uncharacterized protein
MEQRVSLITLGVADLKRSREFYERLGWRRSMAKAEGVVFFQAGGMALACSRETSLQRMRRLLPRVTASAEYPWLTTLGIMKK